MATTQADRLKPKDPFRRRAVMVALLQRSGPTTMCELMQAMDVTRTKNPSTLLCKMVREKVLAFTMATAKNGQPIRAYYVIEPDEVRCEFKDPIGTWQRHLFGVRFYIQKQQTVLSNHLNQIEELLAKVKG